MHQPFYMSTMLVQYVIHNIFVPVALGVKDFPLRTQK